jgi:16S rRNA pseudouridine516 synthase
MMRLDRLITAASGLSRSQAGKAIRAGRVSVNGVTAEKPEQKVLEDRDSIMLDRKAL